ARFGTLQFRHPSPVSFLAFVGNGNTLLAATDEPALRLWDLSKAQESRRWPLPPQSVRDRSVPRNPFFTLSADGKTLAWWDDEDGVAVKDLATGKQRCRLKPELVRMEEQRGQL